MPYELKPTESLRKGLRRQIRKQTARALTHLAGGTDSGVSDEAVHEARKCFKRVRAVLQLIRPSIGERRYRAASAGYRAAGRSLAPVRDAAVAIETLDQLADRFPGSGAEAWYGDAREALRSQSPTGQGPSDVDRRAFAEAAAAVRRARGRFKGCWDRVPRTWKAVGDGLAESYRRARRAHRAATTDPTVERLHAWRKCAQRLRHQLKLLRPIWPERMAEITAGVDRAVSLLGEDHDLAMLRQALGGDDRNPLLALIDRRRTELAEEAIDLGRRFFQHSPRAFEAQIRGHWKAWRR